MSAFTVTPQIIKERDGTICVVSMDITFAEIGLKMRLLCNQEDSIIADDHAGIFEWNFDGQHREEDGLTLALHEDGFLYKSVGDCWDAEMIVKVNPEDFKQMLREALNIKQTIEKYMNQ